MNRRDRRARVFFMVAFGIGAARAGAEPQPTGRAVVKQDEAVVHASMAHESEVVARLSRGTIVKVELVLPGAGGSWCRIARPEEPKRPAYVRCDSLDLRPAARWQSVGGGQAPAKGITRVPIIVLNNLTLVSATLNRTETAIMVVDTGASFTLITPALASRLGITIAANGPRRRARVVGGEIVEAPVVRLASLQLGEAEVENLEVGIFELDPTSTRLGGLVGGDFLHQFKVTFDKAAREMRLE